MKTIRIEPFEGKVEDLSVYISNQRMDVCDDIDTGVFGINFPFTRISSDISVIKTYSIKTLDGNIYIFLRSQSDLNKMGVLLSAKIYVNAMESTRASNMMNKLCQFLFERIDETLKQNEIVEKNGCPFSMPNFLYSDDDFELFGEKVIQL